MAKSEIDLPASTLKWTDITTIYPELGGATTNLQCKGPGQLLVFFSASSTEPTDDQSGWLLQPSQDITGTNTHIWVRAKTQLCTFACGLTD